jgi:molybdenum cofactor cytidylyltransferase
MICAIVLAAGRSRRMGTQKLLLPFAGGTVIGRVVDALLSSPVDRVLVVIPPDEPQIRSALAGRRVELVENPDPQGDMLSSVRCGLRALPAETETILVAPGDQPSIDAGLVSDLLAAYRQSERGIVVPLHAGRRGHPLVFSARFRSEILARFDDLGLRGLLASHPAEVFEWPTPNPAVLEDLDTPEAYRQAVGLQPPRQPTTCG